MVTVLLIVIYLIDFIALILKLVEVINVDWVWILFPYWFPILVLVVVFLIANIREFIADILWDIDKWKWDHRKEK